MLEPCEVQFAVTSGQLKCNTQSEPFAKEPALSGRGVVRGKFNFGKDADHGVCFVWDAGNGKLYLDLNRNRDLTDDANGAFTCLGSKTIPSQNFSNIRLTVPTAAGAHPFVFDLLLHNMGQFLAMTSVRSYWSGRVSLHGRDWQVGLIENLNEPIGSGTGGDLLLRPWEDRAGAFSAMGGSLDAFGYRRNLFVDGHAYELERTYVQQENAPRFRLQFRETPVELGELNLAGKHIGRAVLVSPQMAVVFDSPGPIVKAPVGKYENALVVLKSGSVSAIRKDPGYPLQRPLPLEVSASTPATLKAGGPLTNAVSVTRRGKLLNFSYSLTGAEGEAYELQGVRKQPGFAVYRDGKQIASGKFEFG